MASKDDEEFYELYSEDIAVIKEEKWLGGSLKMQMPEDSSTSFSSEDEIKIQVQQVNIPMKALYFLTM